MEGNRFDNLTREMAVGVTRRQFLKRTFAGATGGALAIMGLEGVQADGQCLEYLEKCRADSDCCTGKCESKYGIPSRRRRCVCPSGGPICDGQCCPDGFPCIDGVCQDNCPPDLDCEDGDLCTVNACDPATGCVTTIVPCTVCQVCSEGECIADLDQDGDLCPTPDTDGVCVNGVCVVDQCDDECPECQGCANGECVPDSLQDGLPCAAQNGAGVCLSGACIATCGASDECPPCHLCTNLGCMPHQGQNGSMCVTPDGEGVCDNGICVIVTCDDECPVCQECSQGSCVADPGTQGFACSSENANFICINGSCVCPVDAFICVLPAEFSHADCACICPGISCPDGSPPNPSNLCQCP